MKHDVVTERVHHTPVEAQQVEVVERKGLGHPDTLCDLLAEAASFALCEEYERAFGRVLHHDLDKMLLVAGRTSPWFGGGRVLEPMRLVLGAGTIHASVPGLQEVYVRLVSRIGAPLVRPLVAAVQAVPDPGLGLDVRAIETVVSRELEALPAFLARLRRGELPVC